MTRLGKVQDVFGAPVAGARIGIVSSDVPIPEIALVSGDDGTFLLNLPDGVFTFRAHGDQGEVGEAVVQGGDTGDEIVITLAPGP
jgi:hypothetical protein